MTTTYLLRGTHKASGWRRELILTNGCGSGEYRITPTDDTGTRIVNFMSAGSWANLPNDDRANVDRDRVILVSGDPLPAWALAWLERANAKSCQSGREALQAAIDDADRHSFGGDW